MELLTKTRDNKRSLEPATLGSVMILLNNWILRPSRAIGRTVTVEQANANMLVPVVTLTAFEIILMLTEGPEGLTGTCVYKPHLFSARTIECLLRDFEAVLERMVTCPALPISTIRVSCYRGETNRRLRA